VTHECHSCRAPELNPVGEAPLGLISTYRVTGGPGDMNQIVHLHEDCANSIVRNLPDYKVASV